MTRRKVLTDEQVLLDRAIHKPNVRGKGYGAIAKMLNVGESTIRDAVNRYTYTNLVLKQDRA